MTLKKFFLFFLIIVITAFIGLSSFIGSRKLTYKNQAAEPKNNYQPKRFQKKSNEIKKVVWEEKKIEKAVINKPLDVKITQSKSTNSDPLPITGNWEGKTIKIVPDDKFPNIFKDGVDLNGVRSIKNMPDNKVFIGNYNAFAVKNSDDPDWNNLTTFELPYDPNKTTVLFFTPTVSDNYEVYLGDDYTDGGRIVRMKTDDTFELVADPTDPYGYLKNVEVVPYRTNDGVVAWRQHEIYYLERGSLRKWIAPYKSCGGYSDYDHIATIATDPYDEHLTYGLVSELGFEGFCQPVYITYLYKYEFNSDPDVPLEITKYGKVTGSSGNWDKVSFISRRLDDPTVKMLYGIRETTTDKLSVIPYLYTDGTDIISTYYIIDPERDVGFYDFNAELKPNNQTDHLWFTANLGGISLGRYFDSSSPPPYFLRLYDLNLIANPYVNNVTSDNNSTVYTGHEYLPGQFNDAMITILEGPANTPTPTPTPTSLPTPTPTLSPNPYFGNSANIHFPEPQGYATIPYKPNLSLNTVFTIEGWINMNDSNNDSILVSQHITTGNPVNDAPYTVYYLSYNNKLGIQLLDSSGNWSYFETQTEVLPQQWHHFAFVKDHQTMKIFIDGNLDSAGTISENLAINRDYLTLTAYKVNEGVEFGYDGLMEELRISDSARYSTDFTLQSLPFTRDANTLLLYHFDENNGATSIGDDSGNDNNGSIIGQIEFIPSTVTAPTPSITPTPANQPPIIQTKKLQDGYKNKPYTEVITGYDTNIEDILTMTITNLPPGITQGRCKQEVKNGMKGIACQISGTPTKKGKYDVSVNLSDSAGNSVLRIIRLIVQP